MNLQEILLCWVFVNLGVPDISDEVVVTTAWAFPLDFERVTSLLLNLKGLSPEFVFWHALEAKGLQRNQKKGNCFAT